MADAKWSGFYCRVLGEGLADLRCFSVRRVQGPLVEARRLALLYSKQSGRVLVHGPGVGPRRPSLCSTQIGTRTEPAGLAPLCARGPGLLHREKQNAVIDV